jgi:hypothetical protein
LNASLRLMSRYVSRSGNGVSMEIAEAGQS